MPDDVGEAVPPRRSAAQVNLVRATIVVACFVAATIWLLGPASNYSAGAPTSTTTTHPPAPVIKSQTTVQVANGTIAPNAAKNFSHNLSLQGWNVKTALDTTPAPTASNQYQVTYVYFHPGQQPAAQMVAAELTVPASHVLLRTQAMLHAVPGTGATDVIVILGKDLAH